MPYTSHLNVRLLLIVVLTGFYTVSLCAQSQIIRYKPTGQLLSKAQFDSLVSLYKGKLKVELSRENDAQIVTVDTIMKGDSTTMPNTVYQRSNPGGEGTRSRGESKIAEKKYMDEYSKETDVETFQSKIKSGTYSFRYESDKAEDGRYKVTYFLVPKSAEEIRALEEKNRLVNGLVNAPMPNLLLHPIDGGAIQLKDLKGKVVVLNFWFIGCKPCQEEIPQLNLLADEYKDRGIVFLAPALDKKDALRKFLAQKEFRYSVSTDASSAAEQLSIYAYPTHIVIDRRGKVAGMLIGGSPRIADELKTLIEKASRN